jgi:hypothetical protein
MNAEGSVTDPFLECHSFSANPPNTFPLSYFINYVFIILNIIEFQPVRGSLIFISGRAINGFALQ